MVMDSLVGYVCIHNQPPCPWLVFDNIAEIWKSEQNYYISKSEQMK